MTATLASVGWPLAFELLALGTATGFLAGLLGIGGGMLMVPFLTWILGARGLEPALAVKMAIATSMATILFTSLSSVRAHHQHGAVRWELLRSFAPGILAGGLLSGGALFALLGGRVLALLFALFNVFSAVQMWRDRKPPPSRALPPAWALALVGAGIGIVAGLLGAGGAFMSVPFMVWCNVPIRQAVATSAALGFPIALANTVGYVVSGAGMAPALPGAFGYLYLPALALIALASVLAAPWGARLAHRLPTGQLKRVFALLLLGLALYMASQALRG